MKTNGSLFLWRHALTGAVLRTVDSGVRIQVSGKRYRPDRIERGSVSVAGTIQATCHFSQAGLSLGLAIETAENQVAFSGTLRNHTDKPVRLEQLWIGESIIELGGSSRDYRVYYNSGCQESSGTCHLSTIDRAAATTQAKTDPDDPDTKPEKTKPQLFASTCIQPDHVRSQYVTALYAKDGEASVCLGSMSFQRAETVFFVKPGPSETAVMVSAVILYNGLQLDPGNELAVEEIGVYADKSPLTALERYVDQVREKRSLVLKPIGSIAGLWNYWLAFTEDENNSGAEITAMEYQHAHLLTYDVRSCPTGVVWHRDNAFFESRCKPHLGETIADLAFRMAARFPRFHLCGGVFWGAASECSDFFNRHPEAILRDQNGNLCRRGLPLAGSWESCPSPSYWVDFSHPAAKEFFEAHLSSMKHRVELKTFNLDFMGDHGDCKGVWGYMREDDNPFLNGDPHDAHINRPFETDRVVPDTIRKTLGRSVEIRSYTALFMRYLGLVDVVRIAPDAGRVEWGGELQPVN